MGIAREVKASYAGMWAGQRYIGTLRRALVRGFTYSRHTVAMARRRIVVGGPGDAEHAQAVAHERRDDGDEVVLLGGGHAVDELGNAAVAEDAYEVVVIGSDDDADRLRAWLDEHGHPHVRVRNIHE
jgi:methylmalonyl-CoA mutase cobalamin-binding subunit